MENWRSGTHSKRNFDSSKNYNWRIGAPQMEEERNLNRRNEWSTSFHSWANLFKINDKNSDEIILELIEKLEEFAQFLESNMENDWILLTIAILAKVCSSCFRQTKFVILRTVVEASFLQKLDNYVMNLNYEERENPDKNKYFWRNPKEFFANLLFVCDFFPEVVQVNKAREILSKLLEVIDMTVLYLEEQQRVKIGEKTKLDITTLMKKLSFCETGSGDSPPGNLRKWNVGITSQDFLKPNDVLASKYSVDGRFENVEHYLEVQFRLSKEYFVAPFREHISNCIEHMNKINVLKIFPELRLYSGIVFQSIDFINEEVTLILKSSEEETNNEIFSQHSNNFFRNGTLVFLSKDNFSSVLIGHVIERDHERQYLIIRFEPDFYSYDLNGSYTLLGSKIYYQPHYNVLKALQRISEVDFPMKNFFVDADPTMEPPAYLNSSSSVYTIQGKKVDLFGNNWPDADHLEMDSSQYSAFKAALTRKLNVIQGFPGTGKTYLGLQIVKTLLHEDNRKIWYNGTPILIVSISNQALDLFLEGLISTTSKIIRVGENVTKENVEKFLLKTARNKNYAYYVAAGTWKKKIKKLSQEINKWIRHLIEIKKFNDIINLKLLDNIDENVKNSWFSRASNDDISAWLFHEPESQNVNPHSIEISEIIHKLTEEEKNCGCNDDVTASQEQASILPQRINLLSKSRLWIQMIRIIKELQNPTPQIDQTDVKKLEAKLIKVWQIYRFFPVRINDPTLSQPPIKPINVDYDSPHSMESIDRWNLYFYWYNLYIHFVEKKIVDLQSEHRDLSENLTEIGNIIDLGIIKRSLVLGMTISAALRLHRTLQALKCPIMVVEEASAILESHLVASLTKHCEQLILLGDHHKLRPIEATDNIIKSKLTTSAISIMERMLKNKTECHVLRGQHRMSVNISQLLVPHFYPEFDSYRSVTQCPAILGIPARTFFIHQEPQDIDELSTGEYFLYEAKFLINLARYMIQIGYEPEDITILAAYWDQMVVLHYEREKYKDLLKGVQIINVVQYHGHDSKVILLSLVTNNQHRGLGYLKNEHGIIFALSRAKEYLYMMGNINLLCENSEMWPRIKQVLVERNCLGNYFPLCCEINSDHITQIKKPEDFEKIPNGVCSEICGSALNCGHRCLKSCHILECNHIS